MQSEAKTVKQYLAELPADRREALEAVRAVILKNLPAGYEEGMQYGGISYYVPHSVYPPGYHCDPKQPLPFAGIASQKHHMSLSLFCVYVNAEDQDRFREAWIASGKKLDMGKSCVRFKKLDDVPLKVVGQAVKRITVKKFVSHYEAAMSPTARKKAAGKKVASAKKAAGQKTAVVKKAASAKKARVGKTAATAKVVGKTKPVGKPVRKKAATRRKA